MLTKEIPFCYADLRNKTFRSGDRATVGRFAHYVKLSIYKGLALDISSISYIICVGEAVGAKEFDASCRSAVPGLLRALLPAPIGQDPASQSTNKGFCRANSRSSSGPVIKLKPVEIVWPEAGGSGMVPAGELAACLPADFQADQLPLRLDCDLRSRRKYVAASS